MSRSWNNGGPYYRCTWKSEYVGANGHPHPPTVYLRESLVTPALDEWLLGLFDPKNLDATVAALSAAQSAPDNAAAARAEAARRTIAECERRIRQYRIALENDTPADLVAGWIREAEGARQAAERELASAAPSERTLSETEIQRWSPHRARCSPSCRRPLPSSGRSSTARRWD